MAELADARDLGSRGREAVQVQFLSPAFGKGERRSGASGEELGEETVEIGAGDESVGAGLTDRAGDIGDEPGPRAGAASGAEEGLDERVEVGAGEEAVGSGGQGVGRALGGDVGG